MSVAERAPPDLPPGEVRANPVGTGERVNVSRAVVVVGCLAVALLGDQRLPLVTMLGAYAGVVLLALTLERRGPLPEWLDAVQLAADALFLSAMLFRAGALDSAAVVIFVPMFVISTLRRGPRLGLFALSSAVLSYTFFALSTRFGWLGGPGRDVVHEPLIIGVGVLVISFGASWAYLSLAVRRLAEHAAGAHRRLEAERLERVERERLERELAEFRHLEGLGRLAGGVAHEYNNLLTVILGCAHMLEEQVRGDEAQGDLAAVIGSAERAAAMTRQLLALSRREPSRPEVLDLAAVVRTAEPNVRRLLGDGVAYELGVTVELASVRGDRAQLEQVLHHLVANARDATPAGGRVVIDLSACPPAEVTHGRAGFQLCVTDSGPGLDAEAVERVFEPFYTSPSRGQAMGLGLATVRAVVVQHGGSVRVASSPAGTTFCVWLPEAVDEPAKEASAGVVDVSRPRATVLLAEDEPAIRALFARWLEHAGYRVVVAPDGAAALDEALRLGDELDLVVTDVVMPALSGPDFVGRLREQRGPVRVVFMSGYLDDMASMHGHRPEGGPLLQKPVDRDVLLSVVRATLGAAPTAAG